MDIDTRQAERFAEQLKTIFEPLKPLFDGLKTVFNGVFTTIKNFSDKAFYPWLQKLGVWMSENPEKVHRFGEILGGVILTLGAFKLGAFLLNITGLGSALSSLPSIISGVSAALGALGGVFGLTGGAAVAAGAAVVAQSH